MKLEYTNNFKIETVRAAKKLKETYTDAELALLIKKPNLKKCRFAEYRDWVIVNYLLSTGNRLQKNLGHSSLEIVKEYVNIFGNDRKKDFDRFNPLDQLSNSYYKIKM